MLITLLLISHVRICVVYEGELRAYVRFLGIMRIRLYPEKEGKRYLSAKKLRRMQKKIRKKTVKKTENAKVENKVGSQSKKGIKETVDELYELVCRILARLAYKVKVRVRNLRILVATKDAATTALAYCGVCTTLNLLTDMMTSYDKLEYTVDSMSCECDYIADKPQFDVNIEIKMRLYNIISAGLGIVMDILNKK